MYMKLQIVAWPEDRKCERSWLLEKIAGATGVIVMLFDKVLCVPRSNEIDLHTSSRLMKNSLREVST